MNYAKFSLTGKYGHFRYPFANNAPLTYSILPKSALVGLMGAVIGAEREVMKDLYKPLCDALLYSVAVKNPVVKVSHKFTMHSFHESSVNRAKKAGKAAMVLVPKSSGGVEYKGVASPTPGNIEFLEDVAYEIIVAVSDSASKGVVDFFTQFLEMIKKDEAVFDPTLGVRNCFAQLTYLESGVLASSDGEYTTEGFVKLLAGELPDEVLVENLPSRMLEDRHMDSTSLNRVFFSPGNSVNSTGTNYVDAASKNWFLI